MNTPSKDIVLKLNEDYEETGRVTVGGLPVDISTRQYFADVRATYDSAVLASFTLALLPEVGIGWYSRSLARAAVAQLQADLEVAGVKHGVWDMFYLAVDGKSAKVLRGRVLIEPAVSAIPGG